MCNVCPWPDDDDYDSGDADSGKSRDWDTEPGDGRYSKDDFEG